jgi:protein-S-isoprenylcysteine O-methyltransferase Ste14
VLLALVFWKWQPIDGTVWDIHAQPWRDLTWAAYGVGWVISGAATFMIDHFDLLGVRQAVSQPGSYAPPAFRIRWLYRWVRHPLMLGLLVAFWLTPTMSAGHLLFAVAATGYIAVGVRFEERDLRRALGPPYLAYASRVPAIVPRPIGKRKAAW